MAEGAEDWSFPTNPAEFDKDDRISFSKLDNKYIAVHDDGTEYEFDEAQKRWIPIDEDDEALIEEQQQQQQQQQQQGYAAFDSAADDDGSGPAAQGKKRKLDHSNDREGYNNNKNNNRISNLEKYNNNNSRDRPSKAPRRGQGPRGPPPPKQNTAVYVTGLPLDATAEEVAEVFSRKCGVIAEEIDSGRPRIKMYTDADGNFKGDALIVFFKPQSVDMAIMLLDDTDLRFPDSSGTTMHVQAADMSYKKTRYHEDGGAGGGQAAGDGSRPDGNGGNGGNPNPPRRSEQDKAKIIRKTQKLAAKLSSWSDDDEPHPSLPSHHSKKAERTVILKRMFTLDELAEDPTALLDIKEEIREECAKLGAVTNVVLYDEEADGVVSVRFKEREAADACVQLMHGRAFAGRFVEAAIATGRERFRKSKGDVGGGGEGGGKGDGSDEGE
ncbi:hypothetical protein VTJ83DRAFT_474 [Remersonia thermophila]|uniref:RRM domain-containing protein n=1 Tax=Remersonia thermophila TaxID=72144 RepID=A0ABR4DL58_9PEZI